MKMERKWRGLTVLVCWLLFALLFRWIVNDGWQQRSVTTDRVVEAQEIKSGEETLTAEQDAVLAADEVTELEISIRCASPGTVKARIFQGGQLLSEGSAQAEQGTDVQRLLVALNPAVKGKKNESIQLSLEADPGISLLYGNGYSTGRNVIDLQDDSSFQADGSAFQGSLCISQRGADKMTILNWYWPAVALITAAAAAVMVIHRKKPDSAIGRLLGKVEVIRERYTYLMKMLIVRDFKVKYKASVLGILWSFLNPLLMTLVYYFVFSTIFRNDSENFVIYLMSGIILYNFFSESTNLGLAAIVGNAGLITKVYVPKYIYPISKVLSSSINLGISLIPLLLVMALSGTAFTRNLLLLPLAMAFIIVFSIGVSLILSALNVFFRDVQFLWTVVLTIWNFLTPIFYPESIIPQRYIHLYHLNPLYQFTAFLRSIVLHGQSPAPLSFLYCLICAVIPLVIGIVVFRKLQDKFVLYL